MCGMIIIYNAYATLQWKWAIRTERNGKYIVFREKEQRAT